MKEATLLFLMKDDNILLAMKKRGFGQGKFNGVGGKIGDHGSESVEEAAIREAYEEINVTVNKNDLNKVAQLDFLFNDNPGWNQTVHVFTTMLWSNEPQETEEMKPVWYAIDDIPYDNMWVDDYIWLPPVLEGNLVKGRFVFAGEEEIVDSELVQVTNF